MAELILSAVGVGIAIPEFAKTVTKSLDYLADMGRKYKNAPKIVQEISVFARDLGQGKLTLDVSLAEWASRLEDLNPKFKDSLHDYLQRLQESVVETSAAIERLYDKDGSLKRFYFSTVGERRVTRAAKKFHRWQEDFVQLIELIEKEKSLTHRDLLLSSDQLMIFSKGDGEHLSPVPNSRRLFVGKGEFKNHGGGISTIDILVERRPLPIDEISVARVASRLSRAKCDRGILACIGYRQKNGIELLFRIPSYLHDPRPLNQIIGTTDNGKRIPYPLESRLELCHELCRAALSVHTSNFVHKNIRPENILLFRNSNNTQTANRFGCEELGVPFLTDWYMLRSFDDLSSRRGVNDWVENIYRHPQRQSLEPQARYNLGHDIYSLGVTLLEIALWESFVSSKDPPEISQRYRDTATEVGGLTSSTMDPARLFRKLTAAVLAQKVMVKLAREEVPSRMGTSLSQLIVACLTCLEGGMGEGNNFEENPNDAALGFHELVDESFPNYV